MLFAEDHQCSSLKFSTSEASDGLRALGIYRLPSMYLQRSEQLRSCHAVAGLVRRVTRRALLSVASRSLLLGLDLPSFCTVKRPMPHSPA